MTTEHRTTLNGFGTHLRKGDSQGSSFRGVGARKMGRLAQLKQLFDTTPDLEVLCPSRESAERLAIFLRGEVKQHVATHHLSESSITWMVIHKGQSNAR